MISVEELNQVVTTLETQVLNETLVAQLRAQLPGKHFTYCMEDDISQGVPVITRPNFAIYLVDSTDHCSCLTQNLERASGFVLAEIITD
jgi:hypothetical protein